MPDHVLQVVVGSIVLAALLISLTLPQLAYVRSPWARRLAALVGGGFNTTAGVAAPAMVVYANLSRWNQTSFAATMQPTFMTMGLVSVILKSALFPVPHMALPPWWMLPALAISVAAGSLAGNTVAQHITSQSARRIAILLALAGGVLVLLRGLGWA
ncbi:hypothetical protein AUCHE_09_00210 [Austwickia chelonae NBRC 105200]|uniref:Probable membrane transporter protein n=1 Tax=Austwickia chelonae NBRC 105200 TaxID=1184607 RepID=K6VSU2_9MICO|nr:hypothetical protein AUCHE_09_00210 [Austwickia chelonae NBRC 105200]